MLELFETRYADFTVKHFHEKLADHGIRRSYTWTKKTLQAAGKIGKAKRRGAHRLARGPQALADILCIQEERTVGNDNTVRYQRRILQIPADRHRHHYVRCKVRVHEYPDGILAVFHGPRCLARYRADGSALRQQAKAAA